MQFRGLLALGLGTLLAMSSGAFALPSGSTQPAQAEAGNGVVLAAAPADAKKKVVKKQKKAKAKKAPLTAEEQKAAAEAKKAAAAKLIEAKKKAMLARSKALEEKQRAAKGKTLIATAKAKPDEGVEDTAAARKAAKARASEENALAKVRAEEAAREAELAALTSLDVVKNGNNGEIRSDDLPQETGFLGIFGSSKPRLRPETRALDAVLERKKKFKVRSEFEPQDVEFSGYPVGTIVIDTASHFLYHVKSSRTARRYGIAVGQDGLQFKGTVRVGDKQEWPRWIPTLEMQKRDPKKYARYAEGMPGGGDNPLGARAIYLYSGKKDTHLRIHGTIAPQTIGTNSSNGCFRMVNEHVIELYSRVKVGTQVIVL